MLTKMPVTESEFFREATLRIYGSLNIHTALKKCMEYLTNYIPITAMTLGYLETDILSYRYLATIWPSHMKELSALVPLP